MKVTPENIAKEIAVGNWKPNVAVKTGTLGNNRNPFATFSGFCK